MQIPEKDQENEARKAPKSEQGMDCKAALNHPAPVLLFEYKPIRSLLYESLFDYKPIRSLLYESLKLRIVRQHSEIAF